MASRQAHPTTGDPGRVARDEVDNIVDQWSAERPDIDSSSIGVFGRITRLNSGQRHILQTVHDRHGLTLASFDVLANLRRSGPPHRKTAGELAESSLLTTGGITFRLDKMEADGLIRRVRSRDDRRIVYAELTDRGLKTIDRVFDEHIAMENAMLAGLSASSRRQLAKLLRELTLSMATVRHEVDHAEDGH